MVSRIYRQLFHCLFRVVGSDTMLIHPIRTAPTNGTRILLYGYHEDDYGDRFKGFCEGYYIPINGWRTVTNCASYPMLWTELPAIDEVM